MVEFRIDFGVLLAGKVVEFSIDFGVLLAGLSGKPDVGY